MHAVDQAIHMSEDFCPMRMALLDALEALILPDPQEAINRQRSREFEMRTVCDHLSPDQRDASEPLSSAKPHFAPVDHGPGADAMAEAGKTYEQGLRDALEAVKYVTDRTHRGYLAAMKR